MKKKQCPFSELTEPSERRGLPTISILRNTLKFLLSIREKYGDVSKYKMLGVTNYLVSHPDDIAEVFKEEKKGVYKKTWFHKAFYSSFGNGLFNSFGQDWERQRKQLQPYFSKPNEKVWFPIIFEETLFHINNTKEKIGVVNMEDIIKPLMQGIMSRILFGLKPENIESKKVILAMDDVSKKLADHGLKSFFFKGILNKIPTRSNLKYKKSLEIIDQSIQNISNSSESNNTNSLLSSFSKFMDAKELRDQLFTLYFAGQETTVNTLLWVFYYLAKYPQYQKKAREEILSQCTNEHEISFKNLSDLTFLNAIIDESMRLSPVAFLMSRDIDKDTKLGKYLLKKDSLIMLSMYVTHRHPDFWEKPSEFRLERFINRRNKGYSFFPYGGGQRMCIGMHLAKMEITTIIALFITQYEVEIKSGEKPKPITHLTLKPNNLHLILKKVGGCDDLLYSDKVAVNL